MSYKRLDLIKSSALLCLSWLLCWYFTPFSTGRQHMGLLDKHPAQSRSPKQLCYCYCLMPCTSLVVWQQSTHTYVIKLRGSGTIRAIVTPNSDHYKDPTTVKVEANTSFVTVLQDGNDVSFFWSLLTNVIGPRWELPNICHSLR